MIALTVDASTKVRRLMSDERDGDLMLRVAVRPGGCSGFSYEMYFDTEMADTDGVHECNGVRIVVDPSSAQLLDGATLDYSDDLMKSGFSIDNPNAQRTCGCGQSFS